MLNLSAARPINLRGRMDFIALELVQSENLLRQKAVLYQQHQNYNYDYKNLS